MSPLVWCSLTPTTCTTSCVCVSQVLCQVERVSTDSCQILVCQCIATECRARGFATCRAQGSCLWDPGRELSRMRRRAPGMLAKSQKRDRVLVSGAVQRPACCSGEKQADGGAPASGGRATPGRAGEGRGGGGGNPARIIPILRSGCGVRVAEEDLRRRKRKDARAAK
jgi:hypothetical protein